MIDGNTQTTLTDVGNVTSVTTGTLVGSSGLNSFSRFNVDSGNIVNLYVPTGASSLINLVHGETSEIHGVLNSVREGQIGGNVYFLNPHGLLVGADGAMNVGSLTALTPTSDFMSGFFDDGGAAGVASVLGGDVPINPGGLITIQGKVNAAGDIYLSGGNVTSSGMVATGALYEHADADFSDVVNVRGLPNATTVTTENGRIEIVAVDGVDVSGPLLAEGSQDLNGGAITLSAGNWIVLDPGAELSTRGIGLDSSGGDVSLSSGNGITTHGGSAIQAGAATGDGGAINFSATNLVYFVGGDFTATAPSGSSGAIAVDAETFQIAGRTTTGGTALNASAGAIYLVDGAVLSTRNTVGGAGENQEIAVSAGDSGNVSWMAPVIGLTSGTKLFAHAINEAGTTYVSGDLTMTAASSHDAVVSAAEAQSSIELDGAYLRGNDITLISTADAAYAWDGTENLILEAGSALGSMLAGVNVGVARSTAGSSVVIGSGSIIDADGPLDLQALSTSEASTMTLAANLANLNPIGVGFVYGDLASSATVEVQTGTQIHAADINLKARNTGTLDISVLAFTKGSGSVAEAAVAVSETDITSSATIAAGATIHASGGVSVSAVNTNSLSTTASTLVAGPGNAGIAAAVAMSNTEATASSGADLSGLTHLSIEALDNTTKNVTTSSAATGAPPVTKELLAGIASVGNYVQSLLGITPSLDAQSGAKEKPKLAGAVTYVDSEHHALASIDDGASVQASEGVVVAARVSDANLKNFATSSVASTGKTTADGTNPAASYTLSAAVAYGDYLHDAKATIGESAQVSGNQVGVFSDVLLPYQETWTKWQGLGSITSKLNGTLGLPGGFLTGWANATGSAVEGAIAGSVSYLNFQNYSRASVGRSAAVTILPGGAESGTTTLPSGAEIGWEAPVSVRANTYIEGAFASGNINFKLSGVGGADPGAAAAGGSYNQVNYTNTTRAFVAEGATIAAQNGAAPVGVAINAASTENVIVVGPTAGRGGSWGLNGIFAMAKMDSTTEASVDDEAQVNAKDLIVSAQDDVVAWTLTGAFNMSDGAGIGLSVALNDVTSRTAAFIGDNDANNNDGSTLAATDGGVTAESVSVAARTDGRIEAVSVAAAAAASSDPADGPGLVDQAKTALDLSLFILFGKLLSSAGKADPAKPKFGLAVSGSSSVNLTALHTSAYVQDATLKFSGTGASRLGVMAVNNTDITAGSGSASLVMANNPSQNSSAGIAGSVAVNLLDNATSAYIQDSKVEGAHDVAVNALAGGEQLAVAIGATVNASADQSKAKSVAGSVSISEATNAVTAHVTDSSLIGSQSGIDRSFSVIAYDSAKLGTGGGSLVGGGKGGFGAAVTYSSIQNTSAAYLSGATVGSYDAADIESLSSAQIAAGAGMAAITPAADSTTLGGAFVISEIENTTSAEIKEDSDVTAGSVGVVARDGAGVASLDALVQGDTSGQGADESASTALGYDFSGSESGLDAGGGSSIISVAGVLQAGSSNVGVSFVLNSIQNTNKAEVADSIITSADGAVNVRSESNATIAGYAVGVGFGTGKLSAAGSVVVSEIANTSTAALSGLGKPLTASTLNVIAEDNAKIDSLSGQVTIALGSTSLGAAIAHAEIGNTTRSSLNGTNIIVSGSTTARATDDSEIRTLSITAGGSSSFAFNGSASSSHIANTTEAELATAQSQVVTNSVSVLAEETSEISALSGGAAFSGGAAVGAAVAVNSVENTTRAYLTGGEGNTALAYDVRNLLLKSTSTATIRSLAVGIGAGMDVGVAGSVATNYVSNDTIAFIGTGVKVIAQENVGVIAQSDEVISNASGAAGIGLGAAGIGASVSVNQLLGETTAYISGSGTEVTALGKNASNLLTVDAGDLDGSVDLAGGLDLDHYGRTDLAAMRTTEQLRGVAVNASGTHSIENISVNIAGGQFAGVAGTVTVNRIGGSTSAYIDTAKINAKRTEQAATVQALSVKASDHAYSNGFSGTVAIGVTGGGLGVGVDANDFSRGTRAYIKSSADLRAEGFMSVDAQSTQGASSLVVSGAGGAIVGAAGSGSRAVFESVTESYIEDSAMYAQDLDVEAEHESRFFVAAGGAAIGAVGLAGSVAVASDTSATRAYIEGTTVQAAGDVDVRAEGTSEMSSWSVSGAGGGGAGIAGQVLVALISNETEAFIHNAPIGSTSNRVGSLSVTAMDRVKVDNKSGAVGIALAGWGVGAGASITRVENATSARLDESDVHAAGDVSVEADAKRDLATTAISVGAGASVGIGGVAAVTLSGNSLSGSGADELNQGGSGTVSSVNEISNADVLRDGDNVDTSTSGLSSANLGTLNQAGRADVVTALAAVPEGSTSATIGGSTVASGGSVAVEASEKMAASIDAGAGGLGAVAVGGAVGVMDVTLNVAAGVGDGSSITTSGGSISILAAAGRLDPDERAVEVNTYQGSAGFASLGAAVSYADLTSNVAAHAERGTSLIVNGGDGDITVQAKDTIDVVAEAQGYTAGVVAVGAVIARASREGSTEAAVGDGAATGAATAATLGAGSFTVKSDRSGQVGATTVAGAGGVVSGSGSDAKATETGTVSATIGNQVTVTGSGADVIVNARALPQVSAEAEGFGGSLIANVGVALADATATPTVEALIGRGGSISANTLAVMATVDQDGETSTAASDAEAAGGGLLLGVNATVSTAESASTVVASVDSDLMVDESITISANNATKQRADVSGFVAGFAAVGGNSADASSTSVTRASLGDVNITGVAAQTMGGSLSVLASGVDDNAAYSQSGSGGIAAGAAASAGTEDQGTAEARIGNDGTGKSVNVSNLSLVAQHNALFNSVTDSVQAAALGMSGAASTNTIDTQATVDVGRSVVLNANGINLSAVNKAQQTTGPAESVTAGAGGVFNDSAAKSVTNVTLAATSSVGNGADLNVLGDPFGDPGSLQIGTKNILLSSHEALLSTGGAIEGAQARAELNATLTGNVNVGDDAQLYSAGGMRLGNYSQALAHTTSLVKTYGGVGIAGGHSETIVHAAQNVTVGTNATLNAYGDVALTPGHSSDDASLNDIESSALTEVYNYTAAPVDTEPYANAEAYSVSTLTIGSGTTIESVQDVILGASGGVVTAVGSGTGHNPYLELFGTSTDDSHNSASETSVITMNGTATAGTLRDQSVTIDASGGVTLGADTHNVAWSTGTVNPFAEVSAQIAALESAYDLAASDEERSEIQAQIDTLGVLQSSVVNQNVQSVNIGDIYAAGGDITVHATSVSGGGSLTAYGAPKISIDNASSNYISLDRLTIPDRHTGGSVLFTGTAEVADATDAGWSMTEVGEGVAGEIRINNTYDAGGGTGPAILLGGAVANLRGSVNIFNLSGSVAQLADLRAKQIQIDVPHGAFVVNNPTGYYFVSGDPVGVWASHEMTHPSSADEVMWYAANAQFNPGSDGVDRTFNWYGVANPDSKMYPPVSGGHTNVLTNLPNCWGGGCEGHRDWDNYFTLFGGDFWLKYVPAKALYQESSYSANPQPPTQPVMAGGQIAINAKYIDINGSIQSGEWGGFHLDLWKELDQWLDEKRGTDAVYTIPRQDLVSNSSLLTLWEGYEHRPVLKYHAATDEIELENIHTGSGGYVSLSGQIISTNTLGNIQVNSGSGNVLINNRSGTPLRIRDITAGAVAAGVVRITDTARENVVDGHTIPLTTWYVHRPGEGIDIYNNGGTGVRDYQNAALVFSTPGDDWYYQPVAGQRYEWTRSISVDRSFSLGGATSFYSVPQPGPWGYRNVNNPWSLTTEVTTGNSGSLPDFFSQVEGGVDASYGFNVDFVDASKGVPTALTTDWTYNVATGATMHIRNSVRADNDFAVQFSGNDRGSVSIDSPAGVRFTGTIDNGFGDTVVTAEGIGANVSQSASALINSDTLAIHAGDGIGSSDQPIRANLDGGVLNATTKTGDIFIDVPFSGIAVGQVLAGDQSSGYGDVNLEVAGDILSSSDGDGLVRGAGILLASAQGALGSAAAPLAIHQASDTGAGDGSRGLTATAAGDIHLSQAEGDLRIVNVQSSGGDVTLAVNDGRVIDAFAEQEVDSNELEARQAMWERLKLTGDLAAQDALEITVRSFERAVEQDYEQLWEMNERGLFGFFADNEVYYEPHDDAIAHFREQAEATLGVVGATDDQVRKYAWDRYKELYNRLEDVFGFLAMASTIPYEYDPDFTYTAPESVVDQLTQGAVWLPSQLAYQIDQTALQPRQPGQAPPPSMAYIGSAAGNIRVDAPQGDVGSIANSLVIEIPATSSGDLFLSEEEEAALASANQPGDVTVIFTDGRSSAILIGQNNAIGMDAKGSVHVNSGGDIASASWTPVNVQSVSGLGDIHWTAPSFNSCSFGGSCNDFSGIGSLALLASGPESAITGGGNMSLDAWDGSIGSAEAPLILTVGGSLESAHASGNVHLTHVGGDLRFGQIHAEGSVALHAPEGGIHGTLPNLSINAGADLHLSARDDVRSLDGAPLQIEVGEAGGLSGSVEGHANLTSPGSSLTVRDFATGGSLTLRADHLQIEGGLTSDGDHVTLVAETLQMAIDAQIDAGSGLVDLSAGTSMGVSNVTAHQGIRLKSGGGIIQHVGGRLVSSGTLTAVSVDGQRLTGDNRLLGFESVNTGAGDIRLFNTASTLTLGEVTHSGVGDVHVWNTGHVSLGRMSANQGETSLVAFGSIRNGITGNGAKIVAADAILTALDRPSGPSDRLTSSESSTDGSTLVNGAVGGSLKLQEEGAGEVQEQEDEQDPGCDADGSGAGAVDLECAPSRRDSGETGVAL